ncbi:MAG: MDR/zinc-dependent alcohol dehydrogenase-like family protein [Desulfobacca sp.]|uniref:MDR/zinc-dependent alcohol dehydrogenase-like family protein n=1 Tax=Desulfobacca sp. TaxID=2067990 RepID=UPI00404A50AF
MQALVFDGEVKLMDVPVPEPQAGEALLRVRLAGICGTDLQISRGYADFRGVLGHEFVADVVAAPEPGWLGRRVVGEINLPCGSCAWCQASLPRHCAAQRVLGMRGKDGCLAQFVTLPLANLHLVPDNVPDAFAVFTEPLAAALEILEQVHIRPSSRVLVIGDGRLGLLMTLVLRLLGCDLHLVGRHPRNLELIGARGVTVHLADGFVQDGFEVVIEATGNSCGWQTALQAVRPRGTIVLKSTYPGPGRENPTAMVLPEVTVVGSRCGPFAPALRLLARRLLNPKKLISRIYPLAQAEEALAYAGQRGVVKVLVEMPLYGSDVSLVSGPAV